jgi:ABC-type transporter Mla maintaining outer membrane lipid asymmetry ATPase subunit MlaF
MLFDEPTMSLDPIVALQVLDLVLCARDINHVSSIYVTKKVQEFSYLAGYRAVDDGTGQVTVREAAAEERAATRVMVLHSGRIIFLGSMDEFQDSELPTIRELITLDPHDHSRDPYFPDPWDKRRKPREQIL